jgi:hypothetical protein
VEAETKEVAGRAAAASEAPGPIAAVTPSSA